MTGAPAPPPPPPALATVRAGAWVLYDLANTVYAATLTYLFTPYAEATLGGLRWHGIVTFGSMLVAGLLVPFFGALADQTARTRGYLTLATLVCVAATAALGVGAGTAALLACYFVANVAYNLGLVFYNALLPAVAAPGREGRLSGIGTGVGYVGTIIVLLALVLPLHERPTAAFPLAAVIFLVAALPCLVLVRDPRPPRSGDRRGALVRAARELAATVRGLPRHRALAWFLAANFCLVDVLNTAIQYFASFTRNVFADAAANGTLALFGTTYAGDDGLIALLVVLALALNALAAVAGIALGPWADRAPLAVMRASAVALCGALLGGTAFGGTSALGYLLTLVLLGAIGLSGIWTAGRKLVLLLAPPERVGEYFGLYGITLKLSVVGAAVYGVVNDHAGAKPAMLAQAAQLLLGLVFLAMVRVEGVGHARQRR